MDVVQMIVSPRQIMEERDRTLERRACLRIANAACCESRGCHPVLETVSTMIVSLGEWLNRRTAPPERRLRISIADRSPRTAAW